MKRWITTKLIGTGTVRDAYRPDLKGKKSSYVVTAYNAVKCQVKLAKPAGSGIIGALGIAHLGDETVSKVDGRDVYRVPDNLRAKLKAEAKALGAADDWKPEGYDCAGE